MSFYPNTAGPHNCCCGYWHRRMVGARFIVVIALPAADTNPGFAPVLLGTLALGPSLFIGGLGLVLAVGLGSVVVAGVAAAALVGAILAVVVEMKLQRKFVSTLE